MDRDRFNNIMELAISFILLWMPILIFIFIFGLCYAQTYRDLREDAYRYDQLQIEQQIEYDLHQQHQDQQFNRRMDDLDRALDREQQRNDRYYERREEERERNK